VLAKADVVRGAERAAPTAQETKRKRKVQSEETLGLQRRKRKNTTPGIKKMSILQTNAI
jgi:hypothetical protein